MNRKMRLALVGAMSFQVAFVLAASMTTAQAVEFKVLYTFKGWSSGQTGDGANPGSGLIRDKAGNLYGTTIDGGNNFDEIYQAGGGTAFKIASDGTETILHIFDDSNRDLNPRAGVIKDHAGNLYGTTSMGGSGGTIFKVTPDGAESALYKFTGDTDGGNPWGGLVADSSGNFYGTASSGGDMTACPDGGCGTVFAYATDGTFKVLHAFAAGNDGNEPLAGLYANARGVLYGTTEFGGKGVCDFGFGNQGCGVVFRVKPSGKEKVFYAFRGGNDGSQPLGSLTADKEGNLYGTTMTGGSTIDCGYGPYGCGTVFKLSPKGRETVLYRFMGGNDGGLPRGNLTMDKNGNLYGTTSAGGGTGCRTAGCGTVFKIAPDGTETILYAFTGGADGATPFANLIEDKNGIFYGTASMGGDPKNCPSNFTSLPGCGTVFSLKE